MGSVEPKLMRTARDGFEANARDPLRVQDVRIRSIDRVFGAELLDTLTMGLHSLAIQTFDVQPPNIQTLETQALKVRFARLAVHGIEDLVRSVFRIESECQRDSTRVRFEPSFDQGLIYLLHNPKFELSSKLPLGESMERDDHQAGAVHVESVDHEAALGFGMLGGHARDHRVLGVRATPGDREQARRLVEHQKVRVAMEDGQGDTAHVLGTERRLAANATGSILR